LFNYVPASVQLVEMPIAGTDFCGHTDQTAGNFSLPGNQTVSFTRGIRVAGKEPLLNPDLGMKLSVWYECQ
jgi:hypothetical protein